MTDRRDYQRRALTMQRVVAYLHGHRGGVRIGALRDDHVGADAVERILKRLAIRGLVRAAEHRWVPQPVLLNAAPLAIMDEAVEISTPELPMHQ